VDDGGAPTVLVAQSDPQVREVLARVIEAAGLSAVRLEPSADVAGAVGNSGAAGLVLDLGAGNLAALQAVRSGSEPAATDVRVVVIGTGPSGGRLAWQAGADGFLARPFHARDLQAALTDALDLDDDGRAARRSVGGGEHPVPA